MPVFQFLLVGLIAYLLGAIPFTLIIGKVFYKRDPRLHGSGNLGATNSLRVLGGKAAIAVVLLDVLKAILAVVIARFIVPADTYGIDISSWALIVASFFAILGHAYSPYIRFRGGKGVATSAGCLIAMHPIAAVICIAVFFIVAFATRYVSLGSLALAIVYPITVAIFYRQLPFVVFSILAAVLVIWLHRPNIKRLIKGEEPKFSFADRGRSN